METGYVENENASHATNARKTQNQRGCLNDLVLGKRAGRRRKSPDLKCYTQVLFIWNLVKRDINSMRKCECLV